MKLKVLKNQTFLFDIEIPNDELMEGMELFIGRSSDCHVVLEDNQISRHHAILVIENKQVYVVKNTEFGNLFVNGIQVDRKHGLNDNDKVSLGDFEIDISELNNTQIEDKEDLTEILAYEEIEEESSLEKSDEYQDDNELDKVEKNVPLDNELSENSDTFEETNFLEENDETESINEDEPNSEDDSFNNDSFENDGFENDGFSDNSFNDGGGFSSDNDDKTQVFQTFASYSLKIFGEFAPFDHFKIDDKEILIGRDHERCQIILNDPEVSGVHAKISKNLINCILEDLNSSNGTLLNGERINKSELINGDEFVIGETSFTVVISSELIESEQDVLMPVAEGQEVEVIEEVEEEVDFSELSDSSDYKIPEEEPKSLIAKIMKDPKRKRIFLLVVGFILIFFLFDTDNKNESKKTKKDVAVKEEKKESSTVSKKLSPEVIEKIEQNYALAVAKFKDAQYEDAIVYLDIVRSIDPNYKDTQNLLKLVKEGYEEIARLNKEKAEEEERQKRNLKIQKLVEQAKEAVEKREVEISRNYFSQILEIDPENIDVPQLQMIIDAFVKKEEEKKLAEEQKKIRRQNMVDALRPGKTLYLKEKWYKAIGQLEKFIRKEGMDEDLLKEAADMLKESRIKLSAIVNPLLGKARSFKEGQDLKRAYETFGEILNYEPTNEEALVERQDIKEKLDLRSRKVYREGLISESLSLFDDAKIKFQEVQQISPVGSEYYTKATKKLKDYLE